jgi:hypothetical protein
MSFRRNQFSYLTKEVNEVSRNNRIDNIKDTNQEIKIRLLEQLFSAFTLTNITQANEITDLKLRLSTLEGRYNSTFPTQN